MASCERKPAGRLVSSRPLWSDPRISVQAWKNPPSEDGALVDPIRITLSVDGASWFLPWSKFVTLVNEGNVTVGRNLTGNRYSGNQFVVRYRQCHRLSVAPLSYCTGHDHEIVFGQVQVSEICELTNCARFEWSRLFGGEYGGLPLPRLASQVLIIEALRARGVLGLSLPEGEDPRVRRDELINACGGPDRNPELLDIEPSTGVKESYEDEPDDSEARTRAEQVRCRAEEEEPVSQIRQRLVALGIIRPSVQVGPTGDGQQPDNLDDKTNQ